MGVESSFWPNRAVLVTGCGGFIGGYLARTLSDCGADVVGLNRRASTDSSPIRLPGVGDGVNLVHGCIEDYSFLEKVIVDYGVETVFHLAGQSQVAIAEQFPRAALEANVQGTWNVLEATRLASRPIQVILASSQSVDGYASQLSQHEDRQLCKLSPYAVSKLCSEFVGGMYSQSYDLPVCIARCSNVYGGGDLNFNRLVPGTIQSVLRGEPPVIRGDGRSVRDYLYIDDAVSAYLSLAEAMHRSNIGGEVFYFCSETPASVSTVVNAILRLMNRQDLAPKVLDETPTELPVQDPSSIRTKERLGWSATTSLETGLKQTIEWYRKNQPAS